jgi:hypothetical protein
MKQRITPEIVFSLYIRSKQKKMERIIEMLIADGKFTLWFWKKNYVGQLLFTFCALLVLYTHVTWAHVEHGSILSDLEVARVEIKRVDYKSLHIIQQMFYRLAINWHIY